MVEKNNHKQEVCLECQKEEQPLKIRISFFFDGTLNNAENVKADTPDVGDSYASDLTNVARLHDALLTKSDEFDLHLNIYTEGPGTVTGDKDSMWGAALGTGGTGVKAKARAGWKSALEDMENKGVSKSVKLEITFDTFGFSRGAACARYFIYAMHVDHESFRSEAAAKYGYENIASCNCKYTGLFDTVASYGIKHSNDTQDLSLNAVSFAESGLHLCSAEEHRKKFRLTNTGSNSNIRELFLPGDHSDVGGGHIDANGEEEWVVYDLSIFRQSSTVKKAIKREIKWLTDRGWYTENELKYSKWPYNKLVANRSGICNRYTYIPMNMMADFSLKSGGLNYKKRSIKGYDIPDNLTWLKEELYGCLNGDSGGYDWMNDAREKTKEARHKYFHFSSRYNEAFGVHAPQWSDDDPIEGERRRITQPG